MEEELVRANKISVASEYAYAAFNDNPEPMVLCVQSRWQAKSKDVFRLLAGTWVLCRLARALTQLPCTESIKTFKGEASNNNKRQDGCRSRLLACLSCCRWRS